MNFDGRYLFLDVGGTSIKCSDGRVIPSCSGGTRERIADALRSAVRDREGLAGIGIAIPGPFDYAEGIFRMEHKFAAVKGKPFRLLAGIPDDVPVRFMHDVNAALAGGVEMLGLEGNTALVTLGTGLGFAHTVQGRIQANEKGSPARSLYNIPCRDGILEDYVSARGIRNAYARITGESNLTALQVSLRAQAGDISAMEAFSETGALLGEYLSPLLEELDIDNLLFGGQVARSFNLMKRPVLSAVEGLPRLRHIGTLPEGAVFEGLATLFENDYL